MSFVIEENISTKREIEARPQMLRETWQSAVDQFEWGEYYIGEQRFFENVRQEIRRRFPNR